MTRKILLNPIRKSHAGLYQVAAPLHDCELGAWRQIDVVYRASANLPSHFIEYAAKLGLALEVQKLFRVLLRGADKQTANRGDHGSRDDHHNHQCQLDWDAPESQKAIERRGTQPDDCQQNER